jgi:hypothetical protein
MLWLIRCSLASQVPIESLNLIIQHAIFRSEAINHHPLRLLLPPNPRLIMKWSSIWSHRMVPLLLNTRLVSGHIEYQRHRIANLFYNGVLYMQKLLHSKVRCPSGQDRVWHEQVLRFMQRQHAEGTIPGSPNQPGRTELSKEVARFYGHGEASADRIRVQESLWVR